jgi:hypothetical protein
VALVLTIPTFDDPVGRDIRQTDSGEVYVVRTVWRRAFDGPGSSRPVRSVRPQGSVFSQLQLDPFGERAPSLVSTRLPVDTSALASLLTTVGSATVACHPQHAEAAVEAMVYEVTFGSGLTETRYRWAGEAPAGWEPLGDFAVGTLRLIEHPTAVVSR